MKKISKIILALLAVFIMSVNTAKAEYIPHLFARTFKYISHMPGNSLNQKSVAYYNLIVDKIKNNQSFDDKEAAEYFLNNYQEFIYTYYDWDYNYYINESLYNDLRKPDIFFNQTSTQSWNNVLIVREREKYEQITDYYGNTRTQISMQFDPVGSAQRVNPYDYDSNEFVLNGTKIENVYSKVTYINNYEGKDIKGSPYKYYSPVIIVGDPIDVKSTVENNYLKFWQGAENYNLALWNKTYMTGDNGLETQIFDKDAMEYFNQNKYHLYGLRYDYRTIVRTAYGNALYGGFTGLIDYNKIYDKYPTNSEYTFGSNYYYYPQYDYVEYTDPENKIVGGYVDAKDVYIKISTPNEFGGYRTGEISAYDMIYNNSRKTIDLVKVTYVTSAGGKASIYVDKNMINWFN